VTPLLRRTALLASRHPRRLLAAGIAVAVVAGVFGFGVTERLAPNGATDPASESTKADERLERATGHTTTADVIAVARPPARAAEAARLLRADPAVALVTEARASRDGRTAYVAASFRRDADVVETVDRLRDGPLGSAPGVILGGQAVVDRTVTEVTGKDLARAELIALPILFLLSFLLFRSVVAALLPLLVAIVTIPLAFFAMRLVNEAVSLSVFAVNLVTGLALGLAIDYSLLVVSRYREELARHGPGPQALVATVATAGRTVLFSALTVAAALAALLVFPQKFLYSMGVGGALVALLSAASALLLLPALLALLGPRVNALAPRRLQRATAVEARGEDRGGWYRLSRWVMRRPAPVAIACAVLLVALALPVSRMELTFVDAGVLPKDVEARQASDALAKGFGPGSTSPVVVLAASAYREEAERVVRDLRGLDGARQVAARPVGGESWRFDVFASTDARSEETERLVEEVRALDTAVPIQVTGRTAAFVDQKASLRDHLPLALGVLAGTTLVLLFALTGSVLLPFAALLMNALTIGAAFGLVVLVFQDGRLEGLLGFEAKGALESLQPPVLFALAFGLSTDYGVFLLDRIRELRAGGAGEREAVALALQRTGRTVTAAALLVCVAIGALGASSIVFVKWLGIGTAAAVLLDATIVRALLLPALLGVLQRRTWWAPRPLRALHARFSDAGGAPRTR
jgi:RND superfamily putative drug exporter